MNNAKDCERCRSIPTLVWTLACIGIGAGLLTMGLEYRALKHIKEVGDQTATTTAFATESLEALRSERDILFRDMEAHLVHDKSQGCPVSRFPGRLVRVFTKCREALLQVRDTEIRSVDEIKAMEEVIAATLSIHRELERLEEDSVRIRELLCVAWPRVQENLSAMRTVAQKLEGRFRLQEIMRQRRNTEHKTAADSVAQDVLSHLQTLNLELSDE